MTSFPIPLLIAYPVWYFFLGHQMTNVIYATRGLATHPPFLPFFAGAARVLGAAFLLYFAYKSHWYFALILYLMGFVGQFVLVRIEMAFGFQKQAWAISLIGVLVLPIVLSYMIYVVMK